MEEHIEPEGKAPFGAPVSKAPQGELPDHGREHEPVTCLKCGEPESEGRNVDEYGICDDCAGREYRETPSWCNMFRNADNSQPYCDTPELEESARLGCPVYIENMKAEEEQADDSNGVVLCPHCEKQVPDTLYCQSCGKQLLPDEGEEQDPEEPAHEVTDNERKWLGTPVKDLRNLRDSLL